MDNNDLYLAICWFPGRVGSGYHCYLLQQVRQYETRYICIVSYVLAVGFFRYKTMMCHCVVGLSPLRQFGKMPKVP